MVCQISSLKIPGTLSKAKKKKKRGGAKANTINIKTFMILKSYAFERRNKPQT